MNISSLQRLIQHNCHISDARDNGIYSMCTLFMRLRGLYKWETGLAPWEEPAPADLLGWIEKRETFWETIRHENYHSLPLGGHLIDPFDTDLINERFAGNGLVYGGGYGRSLKAVFFLGKLEETSLSDSVPTLMIGHELAKELASPFAMRQDGVIYFRLEPFRYFLWDKIMEGGAGCREGLLFSLAQYRVLDESGRPDRFLLRERLHEITAREARPIIHHELGEIYEDTLTGNHLRTLIATFPDTPVELFVRGVKDILADTHPRGTLAYIAADKGYASLGFYLFFLDGMRRLLFPEITRTTAFFQDRDWRTVEKALKQGRETNLMRAERLARLADAIPDKGPAWVRTRIEEEFLIPLGLGRSESRPE